MSDVILLLFMIALFTYTAYALWTAPKAKRDLEARARQRRTNPVWKDRGTL